MASYNHSATPQPDRTGADFYPQYVGLTGGSLTAQVKLRDVKFTTALGTKSNLVLIIGGKSSATITLTGMVLTDVQGSQDKDSYGDVVLTFMHESADGTTVPVA
jgi:hypothetical protein